MSLREAWEIGHIHPVGIDHHEFTYAEAGQVFHRDRSAATGTPT